MDQSTSNRSKIINDNNNNSSSDHGTQNETILLLLPGLPNHLADRCLSSLPPALLCSSLFATRGGASFTLPLSLHSSPSTHSSSITTNHLIIIIIIILSTHQWNSFVLTPFHRHGTPSQPPLKTLLSASSTATRLSCRENSRCNL